MQKKSRTREIVSVTNCLKFRGTTIKLKLEMNLILFSFVIYKQKKSKFSRENSLVGNFPQHLSATKIAFALSLKLLYKLHNCTTVFCTITGFCIL